MLKFLLARSILKTALMFLFKEELTLKCTFIPTFFKGNTLLNYCGVREDFIDYVVDRNHYKHGKFLPGTHIPVYPTERIAETKPDYVLILPWNLKDEIGKQLEYVREWGARLVVPIPELTVF